MVPVVLVPVPIVPVEFIEPAEFIPAAAPAELEVALWWVV